MRERSDENLDVDGNGGVGRGRLTMAGSEPPGQNDR